MRNKRGLRRLALLFFGIFVASIAAIGLVNFASAPRNALGDRTITILTGATKVETFRLDDTHDPSFEEPREIRLYPLVAKGQEQGEAFARSLSGVLLNGKTYLGPNDTSCLTNPSVAFRLWKGRECVEVILCFHCDQMLITTKDAGGRIIHKAYTEMNFSRPALLSLAQEAFPADREIQALK